MRKLMFLCGCIFAILSLNIIAQPAKFVVQQPQFQGNLSFQVADLYRVAKNTLAYLQTHADDHYAVHAGTVFNNQVSLSAVKSTLALICKTVEQDQQAGRKSRLLNDDFLAKHFQFLRWQPDTNTANKIAQKSANKGKKQLLAAIPNDKLLLTKYYTKLLNASHQQSKQYNQALYALPYDEQGLSLAQAEQQKARLTRYQYTRQQVMSGVLLKKQLAKPLIWLSAEALHDVLLQGTGVFSVDDKIEYYNVHRNNGIAYDYHLGKREQQRYWYFAKVPGIMGYGKTLQSKIQLMPQVSVAGNVKQLGLGKLFLIHYQEHNKPVYRLAVLADEGGAFNNNLFQLDLLVNSYYGWQDYYQANKSMPDYASVWLLLAK